MKRLLSSRGLFILCLVLLAATNIVVLVGVAANRSGEPEARIVLTERELALPARIHEENSGLSLRIAWRTPGEYGFTPYYSGGGLPSWLNGEKLKELGFDLDDRNVNNRPPIGKEVFIVLEMGGPPHQAAIKRAEETFKKAAAEYGPHMDVDQLRRNYENAERELKRERVSHSRLFAIDAGLNPENLREKYPDRARFIITKGLVKPGYYRYKLENATGYISRLSVAQVNVPLKLRKEFAAFLDPGKSMRKDMEPPRYEVELAYGSRFEPWIMAVRPLSEK